MPTLQTASFNARGPALQNPFTYLHPDSVKPGSLLLEGWWCVFDCVDCIFNSPQMMYLLQNENVLFFSPQSVNSIKSTEAMPCCHDCCCCCFTRRYILRKCVCKSPCGCTCEWTSRKRASGVYYSFLAFSWEPQILNAVLRVQTRRFLQQLPQCIFTSECIS